MRTGADFVAVAARLAAAAPETAEGTTLATLVRESHQARCWLDAFDARLALAANREAAEGRCEPAGEVLADHGRRASSEAKALERRAGVCDRLPELHDALAAGEVSAGHLDAVSRASSRLAPGAKAAFDDHADDLVAAAKAMTVSEFSRHCQATAREASGDDGLSDQERLRRQRTVSRWRDPDSGLAITKLTLDPFTDEAMWTTILAAVRAKAASGEPTGDAPWDHVTVDTIVELVTRPTTTARGDRHDPAPPEPTDTDTAAEAIPEPEPAPERERVRGVAGRVPEVCIHVDWTALYTNAVGHGAICETAGGIPVPVATVRRLCCDANIYPLVIGTDGAVLDAGRATRLATPDQRRALSAMYTTCAYPGCQVGFGHCQIHHVTDWTHHRGPTDLSNLLPLCATHHHRVHEGHWQLQLHPDRTITLTRPDGQLHYHGTSINRRRPHAA